MTYQEVVEYLYNRLPMFHRIGAAAYKASLENIETLASLLKNPEKKFKSVHVAGTNGKGSVSHMLASIFQEAGYKTGLFTSPHLKDFRERIRINGKMIPEKQVCEFVALHLSEFETIKPSFFEWTTALAFDYFAYEQVDVAIIETGLGGRLDSTNIVTPELSIITNISNDHKYLLGDTIEKIAFEKSGIIKPGVPVIIGERQPECAAIFSQVASDKNAPLFFASDLYRADSIMHSASGQIFRIMRGDQIFMSQLFVDLLGIYQQKNICTSLHAVEILGNKFDRINKQSIEMGVGDVVINTGLLGRWQVLKRNPLTIADVGHNEAGIRIVIEQVSKMSFEKLHIVFGMVNDKEVRDVLRILPPMAEYYFCKANIPRALDENELLRIASEFKLCGKPFVSVKEALSAAGKSAGANDLIFIGGSVFVVAEVL